MSNYRFKQRRGTTDNLNASTDKPLDGEIIIERCVGNRIKIKVGDGEKTFVQLPYIAGSDLEEYSNLEIEGLWEDVFNPTA